MINNNRYCVIMCGGIGSRLWPQSRTSLPKQFIDFLGTGKSLLQLTVDRIKGLVPDENIILLTNHQYADIVREQLPQFADGQILMEPSRHNTAPGNAWAAHHIRSINPDAKLMVVPSDQLFLNQDAFRESMTKAFKFIELHPDVLLTFGVKPHRPETAYGYIQAAEAVDADFSKVKTFTEKPPLELAKVFVKSGEFFWNSGVFFWDVNAFIKTLDQCAPKVAAAFSSDEGVYGTDREQEYIEKIYPSFTNTSIDYAVLDKAENVYVQRADLPWTDLGTWGALYDVSPKTTGGNVTQGASTLLVKCENTLVSAPKEKLVVASGLKDYVVADTPDALLIVPREEEQKVRTYVHEVKSTFGDKFV